MTQLANMPNTSGPASNAVKPPALPAEEHAANGPAQRNGFEFLMSIKRSLTGEAVSAKQLLVVTSQLSVMLAAGCDLCAGLEAMAKQQAHPALKKIMTDLHSRVKQGQSFSSALAPLSCPASPSAEAPSSPPALW